MADDIHTSGQKLLCENSLSPRTCVEFKLDLVELAASVDELTAENTVTFDILYSTPVEVTFESVVLKPVGGETVVVCGSAPL